ncbi:MAG: flagellar motor stator protein MotA [Deltaproteobacteria bacterium]|jgi:chemotaxis protein MotA|nr:flagellar motor stator protein MotA [Deltaproteobacteria bacterium]
MLIIVGYIVVFGSVLGGFMMSGGNIMMLVHVSEVIIIAGAGIGAFVAGCTGFTLKGALKGAAHAFGGHAAGKAEYLELLSVLFGLFSKMHREGVISIEKDIEQPESSAMFQRYPKIAKDKDACRFIGDTLRVYLTTGNAGELEKLMGVDMKAMHEEEMIPAHSFERMAESLPGMGIVAAVLGVVLTMSKINEGAEVLGHSIGAALVGTFVGILLCYGVFGPIAGKMISLAEERGMFFAVIREAVAAAVRGSSPIIAIEYGRRAIPLAFRPTFQEMEQSCKG